MLMQHTNIFFIIIILLVAFNNASEPAWSRWIGGVWIPKTGSKLYNAHEIATTLENRSLLVLGDSLGRRLAATLAAIIQASGEDSSALPTSLAENEKLLNLGAHGEVKFNLKNSDVTFRWVPHAIDLVESLEALALALDDPSSINTFTDIVICIGIHDAMDLKETDFTVLKKTINDAMTLLEKLAVDKNIRVIWRTAPYRWKVDGISKASNGGSYTEPDYSMTVNRRVVKLNSFVREWELGRKVEDRHVYVMEFGREMAPKSVGHESILSHAGTSQSSPEHFNIYGRMVCVEMLMHTWELWGEGQLESAQQEEESGDKDIPEGEKKDLDMLLAMEKDGAGEVTPFKQVLNEILKETEVISLTTTGAPTMLRKN